MYEDRFLILYKQSGHSTEKEMTEWHSFAGYAERFEGQLSAFD